MKPYFEQSCQTTCTYLMQANDHYQYLLSRLTHEIRNPLTLIYSSLQLIEKDCPSVSGTTLWPQLKQDVQDTIYLLMDLSSPDEADKTRRQPVFLSSVLEKITVSCSAFMNHRDISFLTDISPELPPVLGNEIRLKEAILNLLLNSCDAAAENISGGTVCLSAREKDHQVLIHIRDNGPGIPEAYRETLFDTFVTHKPWGTGMGLGVVNSVIHQHGGSVSFQTSTLSQESFTDFCLTIPAAR